MDDYRNKRGRPDDPEDWGLKMKLIVEKKAFKRQQKAVRLGIVAKLSGVGIWNILAG
jgi:hypothetical protein